MTFRIVADAIVVLHLGFVLFVVFGGLFAARWSLGCTYPRPAGVRGWSSRAGSVRSHRSIENWLRQQGGGPVYTASFIQHYLVPILYPSSLSRGLQWIMGGLVVLVNAAIYLRVFQSRGER